MSSLSALRLESNSKINFNGGDLSSDRHHKNDENLCQLIYQILAGYFNDNDADELTNEPIFKSILEKSSLASQPTLSRFWNRMDETTLQQFNEIVKSMGALAYIIKQPDMVLLDLVRIIFIFHFRILHQFSFLDSDFSFS